MAEPETDTKAETNDIAETSPYSPEHPSQNDRVLVQAAPVLPLQVPGQPKIVDPGDAQPIHPDARL